MGERRLRATKQAGLRTIPAVVKDTADEQMLHEALLENLHRSQLNPLEEASAYQQLIADFGITHEQLGARLGRSRPMITNTVRLLRLPEHIQRKVAAGVLSAGHARAVLSVMDPELMDTLVDRIINEQLNVRQAEAAAVRMAGPVEAEEVDRPAQRAARRDRRPAGQPLRHPRARQPEREARPDRHRLRLGRRPQPHPRRHRRGPRGRRARRASGCWTSAAPDRRRPSFRGRRQGVRVAPTKKCHPSHSQNTSTTIRAARELGRRRGRHRARAACRACGGRRG